MQRYLLVAVEAALVVGCSDPAPAQSGPARAPPGCPVGSVGEEAGGCCAPATLPKSGGGCVPAGIASDACAAGFTPTPDSSCEPLLPAERCGSGLMAIPGETACRPVAACTSAPWGDAPIEPSTVFVDASFAGSLSDGSALAPWPTIQAAIDTAAPGAVVAVAAGSYHEAVAIVAKPVRLWGSCPASVEIVSGVGAPPLAVMGGADGAELHDLAVRGEDIGVRVEASESVLLDRVWVHDTANMGIYVVGAGASATVRRSLVERAANVGVQSDGAAVTVEETVVRAVRGRLSDAMFGRGIDIDDDDQGRPGNGVVRASLIEDNHELGIQVFGSDITIEGTVVRGTLPEEADGAAGRGINAELDPTNQQRANVTIRATLVDGNRQAGVFFAGSDGLIENSVVRGTAWSADAIPGGVGVKVEYHPAAFQGSNVTVRSSVVERNHELGVSVVTSDATLESTIVRDTLPAMDGTYGRGVETRGDPGLKDMPSIVMRGSDVDGNLDVGVLLASTEATIESTRIRNTRRNPAVMGFACGASAQLDPNVGIGTTVTFRFCAVEDNEQAGIVASGSHVVVEASVVAATIASTSDHAFGDGIDIASQDAPADIRLIGSRIAGNARAGLAVFGAHAEIQGSSFDCNGIQLDAEAYGMLAPSFDDGGENVCGCDAQSTPCAVLSSMLTPATAPDKGNQ